MQEIKICKHCKHYSKFETMRTTRNNICMHEQALMYYDNVTGHHRYNVCSDMRQSSCGRSAVLFEPKVSMLSKVINLFKKSNIE